MRALNIVRRVFLLFLLAFILGSCKHDLVGETTLDYNEKKNAADYDDYIFPPQTVSASSGDSRCIKLSWSAVENAVRYQIYSAETPFDTFTKVIETKNAETSVILDEFAGITKYYTVCAVNYYGTVSAQSCVAEGSTIAVPIITDIDASQDGSSITINWWMDNCTADTYQNDIVFNVYVYRAGAPTVILQKLEAQATERSITVNGLSSMTEYEFIVEAERKDNTAKETGSRTTAETAHRIIPDAPVKFEVEQGKSTSDISLSWVLPSGSWYKENSGQSGFVLHPLYFKVFRKEADSDENFEQMFVLGAMRETPADWKFEAKANLFFNCKTLAAVDKQGNDVSSYISVAVKDTSNTEYLEPTAPYDSYIPGSKITIKDTTALRGKKYLYYVQSFTDDTPNGKLVTDNSSAVEPEYGWQISSGLFSIKSEYTPDAGNENVFSKITFAYKFNFSDFDVPYKYIIEQTKFALDDTEELNPTKTLKLYNSIEELNSQTATFDQPAQETGYYRYKLYLCASDVAAGQEQNAIQNAYAEFAASGKYLVTDDASAVPKIENFVLKDGFKDHFELGWTYNPEYSYIIHFTNKNTDLADEELLVLAEDDECFAGLSSGDTVTYNHTAESGDKRIYSLEATVGLPSFARPNGDDVDKIYETLGTPVPAITSYDYDRITVSWPVVQKADAPYTVSARYADADPSQNLVTDENTTITVEGQNVKCVLTAPQGYDDASLSGMPIEFTVTANNSGTSDSSQAAVQVYTVGPALTQATIGTVQYDRINLSWNKVTGAAGYIIQRVRYTDGRATVLADGHNTYYFDGENLTVDKEAVGSERAYVVASENIFTLTDKYCEVTDTTSAYQKNQSIISWGLPFGYIVIPVKQGGSDSDFTFDGITISLDGSTPVSYQNIPLIEKLGATYGYGQKVHAQKSQSASLQELTWKAPYHNEKAPSVYYREFGQEGEWHRISDVDFATDMQSGSFAPENPSLAYEYLVAYNKSTSIISNDNIPSSFALDKETGLGIAEPDYDYETLGLQKETANKGYLLCVNYKARTGQDYSEIINWDEWDYSKRSIGPERAVLYIKNYNLANEWKAIANLDSKMNYTSPVENIEYTKIEQNTTLEIKVSPNTLMDGSSNNAVTAGLLQVLRDARHFYALELVRGDDSVMIDNKEKVYAYRNINDYEFAKLVMLAMNQGMGAIGSLDFENKEKIYDTNSYIKFKHVSTLNLGKEYKYEFKNYAPQIDTPCGTSAAVLKISCAESCYRDQLGVGGYAKSFNSVSIKAEKTNTAMPDSYTKSLTFSLSAHDNASITVGSTQITLKSDAARRIYIPFALHGDTKWYDKDATYGWWIKEGE